jgi:hypothetical protein
MRLTETNRSGIAAKRFIRKCINNVQYLTHIISLSKVPKC